jgi:hypothetical protein
MRRCRTNGASLRLLAVALGVVVAGACAPAPLPSPGAPGSPPPASDVASSAGLVASPGPSSTPRPAPGHEVYGFLPYWEMDGTIADHLAKTPLTTLALFSVTDTSKGAVNTKQTGYKRITGEPGTRVIREAHERGVRVDLVFTSFGAARNQTFFGNEIRQDAAIVSLVGLVGTLGLDGICVDVEGLDALSLPAYQSFVGRLHAAVVAADPGDRVTVSTAAGPFGAAMAAAAVTAGADRALIMGYDYRVAGSSPGATAPLHGQDGAHDLPWSVDLYAAAGVPPERTMLGLPLYGITWPVAGPVVGAPETGRGEAWIPRQHLDVLTNSSIVPLRDPQEMVEVYLFASNGTVGPPPESPALASVSPSPGSTTSAVAPMGSSTLPGGEPTWTAVYVDSPATLAPKMALATTNGFAGVGFWAIGYERGLPGYTALMARFVAGEPLP